MEKKIYETHDIILPDLELPNPCTIKIVETEHSIALFIGGRDWSWDRKTCKLIGSGMAFGCGTPEE
jgi:hypothetical protein